jgi:hypothetical protein
MKPHLIMVSCIFFGWSGQALGQVWIGQVPAQETSGRVDLDAMSASAFPRYIVSRVGFVESDRQCPEDRGTLRISRGTLTQLHLTMPTDSRPTASWRATMQPIDDETQLYRIETPTCRTEVAVRQQVRRDGAWISLLVPSAVRPSVPSDERRALQRQFAKNLLTPKDREVIDPKELTDRWEAGERALRAARSPAARSPSAYGFSSWPFPFADKPQTCFEALGDYRIERTGIVVVFLTGLPGDLNRFVIERTELDTNRSRVYFERGDCRWELTVGQFVLRDSEWLALPLAPIVPKG